MSDLIITGVIDGPLSGGTPKAVELYVVNDIADLSIYGIGSATNGGGTDGEEFTLSGSATAGQFLYITTDNAQFQSYFGFAADFEEGSATSINGDDAIELFQNGTVVDVFGDINTDGSGQPWEYLDGWASRVANTGPDGATFNIANWTFSGPNALDGETANASATTPFPAGAFTNDGGTPPASFDLQITEIWPGQDGSDVTADWFEITNNGSAPWTSGTDPDLFYDDESADPTAADLIQGLTTIPPGGTAIVVIGDASDATIFETVWGEVADLTGIEVGHTDGAGLGGGGDAVNLWVGDPNTSGVLADSEAYPDTGANDGQSFDVDLAAFSTAGNPSGAVATTALGGDASDVPAIASPAPVLPPPPPPATDSIMAIQGMGHVSPFVLAPGQTVADFFATLPADTFSISGTDVVTTSGIVTAVDSNGFYLQDPVGDGNTATSDAIFVFTGSDPTVSVGDEASVTGTVSEFFPGDTDTRNLPTTQIASDTVTVVSSGNALPAATVIGQSGRVPPSEQIDDDAFATFNPDDAGIDFFESLEAMRITIEDAVAVAPTNRFGEIFAVANGGADATGLSQRGTLNINGDPTNPDFNPEKIQIDEDSGVFNFDFPDVDAGASLGDVTGVVGYGFGNFEVLPTEDFTSQIVDSSLQPESTDIAGSATKLTIASYNVLNLDPNEADGDTDVANGRFDAIAAHIANNLNAPDIIGLQEVQDDSGSDDDGTVSAAVTLQTLIDAIAAAGGPTYEFIDNTFIGDDTNGGQPVGNIRTAFLYNPDRVSVDPTSVTSIQDSDQQSNLENPFFDARLPLAADFTFGDETVTVVNNHFSSKGGSAPILGIEQPFDGRQENENINGSLDERRDQAEAVNAFVDDILATDPAANVVVLGDLNEFEFVSPLKFLDGSAEANETAPDNVLDTPENQVLYNLVNDIDEDERYSFIFQGNSQQLDHILVTEDLAATAELDIVLVNSEFAETDTRASDHDPLVVGLEFGDVSSDAPVERVARGETGIFDDSGAEIVAYENGRYFVSNASSGTIDVYERFHNQLNKVAEIDGAALGGSPNSVDVNNGIVAVAIENSDSTANGFIGLFDATTLSQLAMLDAGGVLPDMLTFSKDGTQIFAAIEGEQDGANNPEGGVAIVDLNTGDLPASTVTFVDFQAFDGQEDALRAEGVRIFPGISASQDLEPEYIAEGDGQLFVTLQENNALAIIDLATNTVSDIVTQGVTDHRDPLKVIDPSDSDGGINIGTQPVYGLRMADAIASYEVGGETFYITANEGDARNEDARVADLTLDPTAFPDAATLQLDENLGRLEVSTIDGDTDGDGDFDELYAYGSRTYTVYDSQGNVVEDSDTADPFLAALLPDQFNANNDDPFGVDGRSDAKGAEPEAVVVGEIDGEQIAFVGLERSNAIAMVNVSDPSDTELLRFINLVDPSDVDKASQNFPNSDLGPEGLLFIPAAESESGNNELVVASEVSGTVSIYEINDITPPPAYTLELLHIADQEANSDAIIDAPNLSAVMNALEAEDLGNDGLAEATIRLSSGDAIIPGLFFEASAAVFGTRGIADIQIQNELGLQAIALGNHEFDFDTRELSELITGQDVTDDSDAEDGFVDTVPQSIGNFNALVGTTLDGQDFTGADFPYLSANLDFSSDPFLAPLETAGGQAPQANVVTSSTVLEELGELIGVVGATTPTLASISSPGTVGIAPNWAGSNPTDAELDALAAEIQTEVDALLATNAGMNKVILLSHMQQLSIEQGLASRLSGVDVIVAGGSNTRLFDDNDIPRDGDSDQGEYPQFINDADGNPVALVNTDGSYKYVGRLVLDFDENGVIIPGSYDQDVSGAYATDDAGVAALGAESFVDPEIQAIVDVIEAEIIATEGNVFGVSTVFLNGNRSGTGTADDTDGVRTQETNLGNLTADANLAYAQSVDPTVALAIKNGGGIRDSIGETIVPAGGSEAVRQVNSAVFDGDGVLVKPEGGISENDIKSVLAFNNALVNMTLTYQELLDVLEHGVSALPDVAGSFPQISGLQFSFDPDQPAGSRVQTAAIVDEAGNDIMVFVEEGALTVDPTDTVRITTLNFLARPRFTEDDPETPEDESGVFIGGGDGYPFPNSNTDPALGEVGADAARVNLVELEQEGVTDGDAIFADTGTEQDALAEYLDDNFADTANAFAEVDTGPEADTRIQNLNFTDDTVIDGSMSGSFVLELLHIADQEAGSDAVVDAPNLSAVLNALQAEDLGNDGLDDATIILSSGDAIIPGLFYEASDAVFGAAGIADIQIQNELGIQAIALGNHEFDFDTRDLSELITGQDVTDDSDPDDGFVDTVPQSIGNFNALVGSTLEGQDFTGAAFPYLSTNLDFSTDPFMAPLETAGGQAPQANVVTSSVVLEEQGELIGVVGATTPNLASISSPGTVGISPNWAGSNPTDEELDALAAEIQFEVDALLAANTEMNKVVLLAHMQQISIEEALAARLENVDIIVAGGSNTRLFDDNDVPRSGDSVQGEYPIEVTNAGGTTTLVVNTDGSYKYVGRLVIEFDQDGNIFPSSYDPTVSGAYATDDAGVAALGAEGLIDPEIQAIADAIEAQIIATEGNVFGVSDVFLNGNRSGTGAADDPDGVRTQETNLGNLTADANLNFAQSVDGSIRVSLKNGGGIRADIGETIVPAGGTEAERDVNSEVRDSDGNLVKPKGGISENDIRTTLAFNNGLVALTVTKAELVGLLEHGVSALPGVSGRFPQIAGVAFSFDPNLPSGSRVQSVAIVDESSLVEETIMENGEIVGDPNLTLRLVTLDFLATPRFDETGNFIGGGDGFPFPNTNTDPSLGEVGADAARVNLVVLEQEGVTDGDAIFADTGTEQDALAEYLLDNFGDAASAFGQEDTGPGGDLRIQNLDFRSDTVLDFFATTITLGDFEDFSAGFSDMEDFFVSLRSGSGVNRIDLGNSIAEIFGTPEELNGDTIENFDEGDVIIVLDSIFSRENLTISPGSAVIGIDADGDGSVDATTTLEGDFFDANGNPVGGDFMAVASDPGTQISFHEFLPTLVNMQAVDASSINGITNQEFLTGFNNRGFNFTLQDTAQAGFNNAIGIYEVTSSGEIVDTQLLFDNVKAQAGTTVSITNIDAGNDIGFFLVQNGSDIMSTLVNGDTLSFEHLGSGSSNTSAGPMNLHVNGTDFGVNTFHSFGGEALNFDGVQHVLSGVAVGGTSMIVGFEDLTGGGDRDFEDVIVVVDHFDIA